jgi:hypothetical protein
MSFPEVQSLHLEYLIKEQLRACLVIPSPLRGGSSGDDGKHMDRYGNV